MTPRELAFWNRVRRRIQGLEPRVQYSLLRSFNNIRTILDSRAVDLLIQRGDVDHLIQSVLSPETLDRSFTPLRFEMQNVVEKTFKIVIPELPRAGKIGQQVAVSFNYLNPRVIDAVRELDTKALGTLKSDVREVARAFVENGLRDGKAPTAVARDLRQTIGLAPNQEAAVRNYERALRSGDTEVLKRALRDKRFDKTLNRVLGKDGKGLTPAQIDNMTAAYRRKFIAHNTRINTQVITKNSYQLGQRLSWQEAIDKGIVPDGRLMKRWRHLDGQLNPRPEHERIDGTVVGFDDPYPTGQMVAGEGDYNCHCSDEYFLARA